MSMLTCVLNRLRWAFRSPHRAVNNGSVWCPQRGEVAMELCLACPELTGAGISDGDHWIACNPDMNRSVYVGGM